MGKKPSKLSELGYTEDGKVRSIADTKNPLDILGYTDTQPNYTPIEGATPSPTYTQGLVEGESLKDRLAKNQNGFDQFSNFLGQSAIGFLTGTVETASYLADWEQTANKLNGEEQDYTNQLAEKMKSLKQAGKDALPIYLSEEDEKFNPTSVDWWAHHGGDNIGTVLGLMIPGLAVGKAAKLAGATEVGANISATVASRYAESTMEANQVFTESYQRLVNSNVNPEEAKMRAGQAASDTWNTNWLFALQDYQQFKSLGKGFSSATKGAKGSTIKNFLTNSGSEGLEEAGQYVTSQEAINSALDTNVDYFGQDFGNRLQDYINDDDFKTSTLLGAAGGAVFQGIGSISKLPVSDAVEYLQQKINKAVNRDLQIEQANSVDDTGTSQKAANVAASELIYNHLSKGTLKNYIEEKKKEKTDVTDPQGRQNIDNLISDSEILLTEQSKLTNNPAIPKELHKPIILGKLENLQLTRLEKQLSSDVTKIEQDLLASGELAPELVELKKYQISAEGYNKLAQSQPNNQQLQAKATKAQEAYTKKLSEAKENTMFKIAFPSIEKALSTTKDQEFAEKAFQLVATKEKNQAIIEELKGYTTKEGLAKLKQQEQAKQELKVAQSTANKPDVTEKEITEQLGKVTTPEAKQVLESKLTEIKQTNVQKNIDEVQKVVEEETTKKPTTQADLDLIVKGAKAQAEENKPVTTKVEQETFTAPVVTPIPVQTVNVKPEEGNLQTWNRALKTELDENNKTKFDEQGNAIYVRDIDGYIEEGEFYLNGKKQRASEVLQTDGNGHLLLDTPLVKIGDTVILKIENNGFRSNPNFVPKQVGIDDIVNVYLADKDGNQVGDRPISQLTSADNPALNKKQEKFNKDLRKQILENGGTLTTTIVHKTIGDTKTGNKANPIAVLEWDYYNDQFTKLPFNPLLLISGQIPNLDYKVYPESYVRLVNQAVDLTKTRPEESMGGIAISRMSADGTHRLEYLENRNLNEQEINHVLAELANFKDFKPETLGVLKDVVLITPKGGGSLSLEKNIPLLSEKLPGLGVITGDNKLLVKVSADEVFTISNFGFKNLMSGKSGVDIKIYKLVDGKGVSEKITLTEDQYQTYKDHVTKNLQKSFRNVSKAKVNTLSNYTDPVTQQVYKDYWDFLNQTRTLTTRLRGSLTGGSGIESSYSSQNAQIYLDPYPNNQTKVEVKGEEIQVVSQPPLAPTPTSPVGTKKADTIKERFAKRRQGKNKPASGYNFKVTGEKELQWFKDNYGEEFLDVVGSVDRFIGANGVEAFGMYYNALVTLAQESPTGTVFHEAGHFVMDVENGLITQARKDKILKEASKIYNLKDESELEEKLMEDYEKYRESNGTYIPKVKSSQGFFAKLLNLFKKLFGFKSEIEKLYKFIDNPNITVEQRTKLLERRNSLGSGEVMFKKAPGFFTFKEQKDAIDSFKYKVMQAIYATGDKISNLESYITDKNKLAKLLNQVKTQFVADANQLLNKVDITEAEEDRLVVLLNTGIISKEQVAATVPDFVDFVGEWEDYSVGGFKQDGFKTKIIQSFADFGFVIKGEDITQEQQNEKIHDIPQEVINPSDSLSFRSKLFLSSIPQPIIDENNQVIDTEKTILGVDKVIDVKAVDAMLSFKLADSINPYARLQELAKVHPIAQIVLNKLDEVRGKGDTQTFQEVLMKYSRNTMDKKTVLHEEKVVFLSTPEVDEKGNKTYKTKKFTTKFIDTNRNSVFRTLIRDWNAEAVHIKFISFTDQLLDKSKNVLKQFSDLQEKRSKLPKNQDVPFDELLTTFKDTLAGMGVTLPVEVWKEFAALPEGINDPKRFSLKDKNEILTKRYNNLKSYIFGSKAATLQDLLDKVKEGINPFKEETGTVLERLARLSAIYMTNIKTGAYLNEKGDLEYPINLPSYLTDFNNLIADKQLLSTYLANAYKDQFNQGNEFLQVLDETTKSNPLHEGKIKLTFLSSFREGNRDAKDFGQRTEIESLFSRFAAFGNSALNSAYGWVSVGTLADKAKNAFFQLPKHKGAKAKELFKRVLNNTVNQELARIQDIREYKGYRERFNNLESRLETLTPEEKAEYNSLMWLKETTLPNDVSNLKGQDKFIYIPTLNSIPNLTASVTKGEISVTEFNEAQTQKDKVIDDFIQAQYESFLRYLQNNDLIRVTRNAKTGNLTIINNKDGIPNDLISTNPNPTLTEINSFLEEFFFNDTAWRLEMSKVFMGDVALYKEVDNSITDDYFKRAYQLATPGYKPFLTKPENVTRASYASQMTGFNPEEVKALTDIGALPETVAAYGTTEDPDTNATDAQSYTSIHGYRKLAINTGAWSKDIHEKLYEFAWKDNLSVNKAIEIKGLNKEGAKEYRDLLNNTVLPSLKPFQFSEIELTLPNDRVRRIKVQYKDSITVVTPEIAATKQGYKQLLDFFQSNPQIDILSAEDTVKVGKFGVISDLTKPVEKWQIVTTSLSDIKFPQMIGEDVKDKTSGSQFHKLVVGDIIDDGDYVIRNKTVKGKKIKEAWNNLWVEKLQSSRQELADLLGLGTDFTLSEEAAKREQQLQKIKLVLENEVAQRGLNENYRDGLQLTKDEQNAVDFMIPLSFPQLGEKYQGVLTNLFKKYIVKQKSPGFVGVNLADFGVDRSDKLGFITSKDGKVVAAEIGLSIDYFKDIGLEYGKHIDSITKKVIWEELNETQKQALEFIAFRIPTSNKSSMLPVRVAYILPGTYGNTVMIPAQSTKQMGLDFDIDKSQLLRRVLTERDYKKNELSKIDKDNVDTKLFDLYWSILTSPLHINDVIDPLNTDFFESLSKEFKERGIVSVDKSAPFYSVIQDAAVETKNREEKAKVGQAALASTAHALLQMIKPYIAVNVKFGLTGGKTSLGELVDSSGRKISKNLGEIQQAALDAAKTPLLSLFGITKNLMPLANTQALFGYDLRTIASFYSHPVVKEWSRLFIQNDSNEKLTRQAFESEPKYLTLVKKAKEHLQKKDYLITAPELDQSLTGKIGNNPTLDAKIYAELTYLYAVSKDITPLVNALSVDTKDDATSIEMLLSYKQQIKDITTQKEGKFIVVDPRVFDLKTAPVETKRLAAYVEYFLNDALKLAGQFYPTTNDNYTEVRNHIINTLGIRETDQELMKSVDQFMNFYSLNHDYKLKTELEAAHPLASQGLAYPGNNKAFRWSFLDPDRSFLHYVDKLINKYPFLEKDEFVNALRNTATKTDTLPLAGIKNTNDLAKSEQVQAWSDLLNDQNVELQTLAHDAVRYAIMTSGFTYHNSSFADLIPLEYWSKTKLKEVWNTSSRNVNKDSALINFVRHKYKTIKYFPSIKVTENGEYVGVIKNSTKFKDNVLQSFTVNPEVITNPRRFVTVEGNLYEGSYTEVAKMLGGNEYIYKLLQPLGSKFYYEAAGDGRQFSNHPDNQFGSPNPFGVQPKTGEFPLLSNVNPEQNDFVADYLPEKQNDPKIVLEKLISEETDEQTKAVLENMLRNVDKLKTTIDLEVLEGKAGLFKIREGNNGIETSISINPNANMNKASDQRRVIIHELDHAFMVSVLQNPVTELEINFNRNVERLTQEAKTRLGNIQGTENKFEFVAELASNPEFRTKLRSKSDLWSRMLRFVRKLFGMKDNYDQLLDQRYQVIDQVEDLQKLTPDEFALKQPKEPKPVVKKLDVFTQIVENLNAKYRRYKQRHKADLEKKTFKDIIAYEKLQKDNKAKFILQYLLDTTNELKVIGETLPKLQKAEPQNISAAALVGINEELASFEVLQQLKKDVQQNGVEYFINEKEIPDNETFNKLLGLVKDYQEVVDEIITKRAAWRLKQAIPNLRITEAELAELLKLNDKGDIALANYLADPNSQTTDSVLQATHKMIKDAYAQADRNKFSILNNDEQQQRKLTFEGKTITYTPVSVYKASEDFDKWVGRKTTLREKYSAVLEADSFKQGSEGIKLISPTSKRGQEILSIKPTDSNYALRQFYETFVLQYLHAQTDIPKYLRPGLRIPSIPRSLFEGFTQNEGVGKLSAFSESLKQQFLAKYDENERKLVNEAGEVDLMLPIRFVSKQDGQGTHLSKEEVSLDLATTLTLAIEEAVQRAELQKIEPDLQLVKSALAERRVAVMGQSVNTGFAALLTRDKDVDVLDSGQINTIAGTDSNSYKSLVSMLDRFMYGKIKNNEGSFKLFGKTFDTRSTTDVVLKGTGFKMLFGNFAVTATNLLMGKIAAMREAVGGQFITPKQLIAGEAWAIKEGTASMSDLSQKQKQTKYGKFIELMNPSDRKQQIKDLGLDDSKLKTLWTNFTSHSFVEGNLIGSVTGAVSARFTALDKEGKEVSFYDGGEFNKNNKFVLKEGHTYKGRKEFTEEDFNEFKNYSLAVYQEMNGIYNLLDSGSMKASSVGAAVSFMRNWLRSGFRSRWQLKRESVELNQDVEGYYVSALIGFNNLFNKKTGWLTKTTQGLQMLWIAGKANPDLLLLPNELNLSEEEKSQLVAMRQSNIRKSMFDLYSLGLLSLAIFLAFSGDEDDDSYTKMMLVRMRRELMTFYSPSTAWDVLRSPTVALKTITDIQSVIWRTVYSPFQVLEDGELAKYEKGKWKDWPKLYADWAKVTGLGQFKQFEDIGTTTRLLGSGIR